MKHSPTSQRTPRVEPTVVSQIEQLFQLEDRLSSMRVGKVSGMTGPAHSDFDCDEALHLQPPEAPEEFVLISIVQEKNSRPPALIGG